MGRRLGQHFLFDPAILDRIVHALDPQPDDRVIEIGPGKGTLTERLAPLVGSVVAIERDEALAAALDRSGIEHCRVVSGDALEIDWPAALARRGQPTSYKVAGNIPYAITTPLIDKALSDPLPTVTVFLVQKEVGDRLAAAPGSKTYGALSVGVQAVAAVERLFTVRAGSFRPPPKVDSVVVRLSPRSDPLVTSAERAPFRRFVTALFGERRKQLLRALRIVTGIDADGLQGTLGQVGLDPRDRPEVLTPGEFAGLFRAVRR